MKNEQNVSQSVVVTVMAVSGMGAGSGIGSIKISDDKLFKLCKHYGSNALFWRRKFLGLLPEVAKRRLYEKHGFSSIFEFGFKLAGVSENQIRKVLNLEIRFRDKKILHGLLVEGKVSVNKLYKVASIATVENQKVLAEQIKVLPAKALETLSRDEKNLVKSNLQNGHVTTQSSQIGLFGKQNAQSSELQLSSEVQQRLLELQKKGININELLTEFLDKREKKIEEEKEEIGQEMAIRSTNDGSMSNLEFAESMAKSISESIDDDVIVQPLADRKNPNRYVPRKIQKIIKKEFGTKCAVPTCNKPAQHLHHTLPFALSQNHDPRYLMPLCKEHHVIAHSVDQKFREMRMAVV